VSGHPSPPVAASLAIAALEARAGGLGDALLRWGEHDVTADPQALVARFACGGPCRRAAIVDGDGHWVQYERSAEVNDTLIRRFGNNGECQ